MTGLSSSVVYARFAAAVPKAKETFWGDVSGGFHSYGWRIGGAVLVLVVTVIVGRIVSSRVRSSVARTTVGPNATVLIARSSRVAVYFLGIVWILGIFAVPFTALAAVVSVTALALSLSLQDLLKSLIAGIYLLAERPFHIGDRITVAGVTGVIDDIQMRATFLHSDQGERIVMPNQTVFTQVIVNNSVAGGLIQIVSIEVPRSMTSDSIRSAVLDAVTKLGAENASFRPALAPIGSTADTTKWQLTVWLAEGTGTADLLGSLMDALPSASITLGAATA